MCDSRHSGGAQSLDVCPSRPNHSCKPQGMPPCKAASISSHPVAIKFRGVNSSEISNRGGGQSRPRSRARIRSASSSTGTLIPMENPTCSVYIRYVWGGMQCPVQSRDRKGAVSSRSLGRQWLCSKTRNSYFFCIRAFAFAGIRTIFRIMLGK
jgi:hypothetical protein